MDTLRVTPVWRRWYFNVAVVLWMLALCAMIAGSAWALLGQPRIALLFSAAGGGMLGLLLLWQACIYPWCRAGDGPSGQVESPRQELRDLFFIIWLPPVSLAIVCLLIWLGEPMLRYHLQAYFHWKQTNQLAPLLMLGVVPLAFWAYAFSRLVAHRFRTRTAAMRVCFTCGYDLHATPGLTCPECGRSP